MTNQQIAGAIFLYVYFQTMMSIAYRVFYGAWLPLSFLPRAILSYLNRILFAILGSVPEE